MSNSLPNVTSTDLQTNLAPQPSPLKTLGFALAIIIGIGGLAAGGIGLAAFLKVGTLSSLSQVNAIIMMTAGSGGGILFVILGIVGSIKNCQPQTNRGVNSKVNQTKVESDRGSSSLTHEAAIYRPQDSEKKVQVSSGASSLTNKAPIYGPQDFEKVFNVTIEEEVPKAPEFDWNAKDPFFDQPFLDNYVLFYIPDTIRVNGQAKKLKLTTFEEITKDSYALFTPAILEEFGNNTAAGWVLLSKRVIPQSRDQLFTSQKQIVEDKKDFSLAHVLEVCVLRLMLRDTSKEFITFCSEEFSSQLVCVVSLVGSRPMVCRIPSTVHNTSYGVACALRKF